MILPLANIAFTLKFIMGDDATELSPYDIAGLIVILIGLVIYRSTSEQAPPSAAATTEGGAAEEVPLSSSLSMLRDRSHPHLTSPPPHHLFFFHSIHVGHHQKREVTHIPVGAFMSGDVPEAYPRAVVAKVEHKPRSSAQIRYVRMGLV